MNTRDLAVKFDAYRHYVSSGEWAQERSSLPRLLCIAPDIAQERRMHRVVLGRLTHAVGPAVWTTTEVLLKANGPIAPIWMQVTSHGMIPDHLSPRAQVANRLMSELFRNLFPSRLVERLHNRSIHLNSNTISHQHDDRFRSSIDRTVTHELQLGFHG